MSGRDPAPPGVSGSDAAAADLRALSATIQRLCAEDEDIAEQGIDVVERDGVMVLFGQVASEHRRQLIADRVATHLGGRPVRNEIVVLPADPPQPPEEIS